MTCSWEGNRFYVGSFDGEMEQMLLPLTTEIEHQLEFQTTAEIALYIHSEGGDTDLLNYMLSLLENGKNRGLTVATFVPAKAYSSGSMLAVSGSPGYRLIGRHAIHMAHFGETAGGAIRSRADARADARYSEKFFETTQRLYETHTKIPDLDAVLSSNTYIYADEAIEWGMADRYIN